MKLDDLIKAAKTKPTTEAGKQNKIERVMAEFKAGKLRSSSGGKVTKRDQAVAIAMSEAGKSKKACDACGCTTDESESHGKNNPVLDAATPAQKPKAEDKPAPSGEAPLAKETEHAQQTSDQPPQNVQKLAYFLGAFEHICRCCHQSGIDPVPVIKQALHNLSEE